MMIFHCVGALAVNIKQLPGPRVCAKIAKLHLIEFESNALGGLGLGHGYAIADDPHAKIDRLGASDLFSSGGPANLDGDLVNDAGLGFAIFDERAANTVH